MKILALLLCSMPAWSAVTFDNFKDGGYSGSGPHNTTIVASGTNLGCIVFTWYRSGSTGPAICGGNAMTKVATVSTTQCSGNATQDTWVYFGAGLTAGTLTVSVTATVESVLEVITVNGAAQSGQPVAIGALTSGTQDGSGQGYMPITTAADKSLVIGNFCIGINLNQSPSTNGTWIGNDGTVGMRFWHSTDAVTPAGIFALAGKGSPTATPYEASGLSIAPFPSAASMVPRHRIGIIQ